MRSLYPYGDLVIFSQRPRSKLPFDRFFTEVIFTQAKIGQISMLFGSLWKGPRWFQSTPNDPNSAHFMLGQR